MFNPATISSRLTGIVGWRQPVNPDFAILDSTNLTSRSGYYVDDHPMASVETLKDTQDYVSISDADFNTFVTNLQTASIINVANAVFNEIVYIDRQVLYTGAQNKINTIDLPDGFVGYEIKLAPDKDLAFEITRTLLNFDGTGDIELLLFNSNKPDTPLFSQVVTITSKHQEVILTT